MFRLVLGLATWLTVWALRAQAAFPQLVTYSNPVQLAVNPWIYKNPYGHRTWRRNSYANQPSHDQTEALRVDTAEYAFEETPNHEFRTRFPNLNVENDGSASISQLEAAQAHPMYSVLQRYDFISYEPYFKSICDNILSGVGDNEWALAALNNNDNRAPLPDTSTESTDTDSDVQNQQALRILQEYTTVPLTPHLTTRRGAAWIPDYIQKYLPHVYSNTSRLLEILRRIAREVYNVSAAVVSGLALSVPGTPAVTPSTVSRHILRQLIQKLAPGIVVASDILDNILTKYSQYTNNYSSDRLDEDELLSFVKQLHPELFTGVAAFTQHDNHDKTPDDLLASVQTDLILNSDGNEYATAEVPTRLLSRTEVQAYIKQKFPSIYGNKKLVEEMVRKLYGKLNTSVLNALPLERTSVDSVVTDQRKYEYAQPTYHASPYGKAGPLQVHLSQTEPQPRFSFTNDILPKFNKLFTSDAELTLSNKPVVHRDNGGHFTIAGGVSHLPAPNKGFVFNRHGLNGKFWTRESISKYIQDAYPDVYKDARLFTQMLHRLAASVGLDSHKVNDDNLDFSYNVKKPRYKNREDQSLLQTLLHGKIGEDTGVSFSVPTGMGLSGRQVSADIPMHGSVSVSAPKTTGMHGLVYEIRPAAEQLPNGQLEETVFAPDKGYVDVYQPQHGLQVDAQTLQPVISTSTSVEQQTMSVTAPKTTELTANLYGRQPDAEISLDLGSAADTLVQAYNPHDGQEEHIEPDAGKANLVVNANLYGEAQKQTEQPVETIFTPDNSFVQMYRPNYEHGGQTATDTTVHFKPMLNVQIAGDQPTVLDLSGKQLPAAQISADINIQPAGAMLSADFPAMDDYQLLLNGQQDQAKAHGTVPADDGEHTNLEIHKSTYETTGPGIQANIQIPPSALTHTVSAPAIKVTSGGETVFSLNNPAMQTYRPYHESDVQWARPSGAVQTDEDRSVIDMSGNLYEPSPVPQSDVISADVKVKPSDAMFAIDIQKSQYPQLATLWHGIGDVEHPTPESVPKLVAVYGKLYEKQRNGQPLTEEETQRMQLIETHLPADNPLMVMYSENFANTDGVQVNVNEPLLYRLYKQLFSDGRKLNDDVLRMLFDRSQPSGQAMFTNGVNVNQYEYKMPTIRRPKKLTNLYNTFSSLTNRNNHRTSTTVNTMRQVRRHMNPTMVYKGPGLQHTNVNYYTSQREQEPVYGANIGIGLGLH